EATGSLVRESGADFGVAWDGDFDRCFFFDEKGRFIEGYYIVGLLAEAVLKKHPGAAIVYDPRLVWNTEEIIAELGGRPVMWKAGHAFLKEKMREEDAVYGGEMSAHHYFRDFSYCDSGMIPWLLVAQLLSEKGRPLSELVAERAAKYPVSGEINRRLANPDDAIARLEARYGGRGRGSTWKRGATGRCWRRKPPRFWPSSTRPRSRQAEPASVPAGRGGSGAGLRGGAPPVGRWQRRRRGRPPHRTVGMAGQRES